jgi:hypothetical protein
MSMISCHVYHDRYNQDGVSTPHDFIPETPVSSQVELLVGELAEQLVDTEGVALVP